MTIEEFKKVPFRFRFHLNLGNEHTMTYGSKDGRLGYCDHTLVKKNGDYGRTYRHYRIDNKIYKTKEKFIEALKDYDGSKQTGGTAEENL